MVAYLFGYLNVRMTDVTTHGTTMMVLTLIDPSVCVRLSSGSDPDVCGRSEDEGFALKPSSMSGDHNSSRPRETQAE